MFKQHLDRFVKIFGLKGFANNRRRLQRDGDVHQYRSELPIDEHPSQKMGTHIMGMR